MNKSALGMKPKNAKAPKAKATKMAMPKSKYGFGYKEAANG